MSEIKKYDANVLDTIGRDGDLLSLTEYVDNNLVLLIDECIDGKLSQNDNIEVDKFFSWIEKSLVSFGFYDQINEIGLRQESTRNILILDGHYYTASDVISKCYNRNNYNDLKIFCNAVFQDKSYSYYTLCRLIDYEYMHLRMSERKQNKRQEPNKTYIMKDLSNGFFKIGRSISPVNRERTLMSEKPTIKLIATLNKDIEKLLHKEFNHVRLRGEWFNLKDDEIKYIISHYKFKESRNDN